MGECRAEIVAMMRTAAVPGLSIAVTRPDQVVYADAFGCGDLATRSAATPDTAYLWFSMSKLVTATAALRLADEGRLDLDAPAVEFGDHLRLACPVQPTIRQLLTHTAGLANPVPIRWVHAADARAPDPQVLLRRLLRRRRAVRYPVGGVAHYSNVGYLLAAAVNAAAAGTPFTDYVQRAVLGPTGMRTTGYALHAGATQATGYVRIPPGGGPLLGALLPSGIVGERHGRHLALRPFLVDGPGYGGIVGGVLDAALFLRMHLADGEIDGHRILAPQTARGMRRVVARGRPFHHAVGWFRKPVHGDDEDYDEDYVEHFGAGAGFWNVMRLYPTRGVGIVVMTNSTRSYRFHELLHRLARGSWGA